VRRFLVLAALATVLLAPGTASAFYGNGAQIVSADFQRQEQADDATEFAAISADGRYVAIQTSARNFFADGDPDPPGMYRTGGIFRFDLATSSMQKVADGNLFDEETGAFLRRGAASPSISADGRYVAFATAQSLLPVDANDNIDVYVRDMEQGVGEPGAFDLVSARDGGDEPAHYGGPGQFPGNNPGTEVSPGAAISADGQKVAFRTAAPSDLPAGVAADIPAGQILVRDRAADTTTLVTAKRDAGTGQMTEEPAGGAFGAVLSADGTTVAWSGSNAAAQTRLLGGENSEPQFEYYLWRRIADGPSAPTRRVTGLADPDDSACSPGAVTFFDLASTGPCYGPLAEQEALRASISSTLPSLSADGYKVALLTGSGPRGPDFGGLAQDLFVTDMSPGVTRKAGTIELTRDVPSDPAARPLISGVTISGDGRYVALVTARTHFTLPVLRFLGAPRAIPNRRDLYVVDMQERTVERATHSTEGGDADGDVLNAVTMSAHGDRIAFVSFAGNLFFGDANQRPDAFVVSRQPDPGSQLPGAGLGAAGESTLESSSGGPQISVRARSRPGGVVELLVSVPAAGGVRAVARGRAGEPPRARTLATDDGRARGSKRSTVKLVLSPVDRYLGELREQGKLRARARVTYVAARGGRKASASRAVLFRQDRRSGDRKARR
jgi:hypothetical protein